MAKDNGLLRNLLEGKDKMDMGRSSEDFEKDLEMLAQSVGQAPDISIFVKPMSSPYQGKGAGVVTGGKSESALPSGKSVAASSLKRPAVPSTSQEASTSKMAAAVAGSSPPKRRKPACPEEGLTGKPYSVGKRHVTLDLSYLAEEYDNVNLEVITGGFPGYTVTLSRVRGCVNIRKAGLTGDDLAVEVEDFLDRCKETLLPVIYEERYVKNC